MPVTDLNFKLLNNRICTFFIAVITGLYLAHAPHALFSLEQQIGSLRCQFGNALVILLILFFLEGSEP